MAENRNQVAKQLGSASNQQALVKKLMKRTVTPVKFVIPGGKTMLEDLDEKRLSSAVYTWLRRCRFFTEATISLASDPAKIKTRTRKVQDFTVSKNGPEWETTTEKRKWLAEQLSRIMFENKFVSLQVKPDGIYISQDVEDKFSPEMDLWEPYVEFLPRKVEQWKE